MIPNALFYTFSTIAQALAGAITLLAAFVLYRLQSLRAEIADDSEHISGTYSVAASRYDANIAEQIRLLYREGRHAEVLAFRSATPPSPEIYAAELEQIRLRANLDRYSKLLRAFTMSLALTVGLIAASVIALALSPKLLETSCRAIIALGVGVAWFCLCLLTYVSVIRETVK
jgi:hypothetical protein